MQQDEEHLRLLSIFHYVSAGLTALFACLPILHVIFGLVIVFSPDILDGKERPPEIFGWILVAFGISFIVIGWVCAGFILATGRFLKQRKHHTFCLVIAAIECLCAPIGTILGVFTIIVLMRESVKQMFAVNVANSLEDPREGNW